VKTAVNVTGDLTACMIFNKFYGARKIKYLANNKLLKEKHEEY